MPEAVAELEGVRFEYSGRPVLADVSLTVRRGEFLGVLGPNGAGKSTLLRVLLGLLPPLRGVVRLFGEDVARLRGWWRVGYVPQRFAGFAGPFPATVREVVATGRLARKRHAWLSKSDWEAVDRALADVGLKRLSGRLIHQLSVGQQQRVAVARALATRPEFLILDEPMAALDVEGQGILYALLSRLQAEEGITVLLVSHDVGPLLERATRFAYLQAGQIEVGSPAEMTLRFPGVGAEGAAEERLPRARCG